MTLLTDACTVMVALQDRASDYAMGALRARSAAAAAKGVAEQEHLNRVAAAWGNGAEFAARDLRLAGREFAVLLMQHEPANDESLTDGGDAA